MKLSQPIVVLVTLAILVVVPLAAQDVDPSNTSIDPAEIQELRSRIESNTAMAADLRTQIIELCDAAEGSLDVAENHRMTARASRRELAGFDREIEALRQHLRRPDKAIDLDRFADLTVEQAEDALARERSRLAANRTALREKERQAEERSAERTNLARRHGELDQIIQLINDELGTQSDSEVHPDLRAAVRFNLLAQRDAARAEVDKIRTTLDLFEDAGALIPLEIDVAQRRVATGEEVVTVLEETAAQLRQQEANSNLEEVRTRSERIAAAVPEVAEIAAEAVRLAQILWGPDGVVISSERTIKDLAATRKHLNELNRIADLTRRKFEAFGRRGSITRWWPKFPSDFPEPGAVVRMIAKLELEIPEIEHQLITYEQQRARSQALARSTLLDLQADRGGELDPRVSADVRELIQTRQDLLDEMTRLGGRYSTQLNELRTVSLSFHDRIQTVERFLYSNVLWSRSVPKPIVPRFADSIDALGWFFSARHLDSFSVIGFELKGNVLFGLFALACLVIFREKIKNRLTRNSQRVTDPETDSLWHTIEALILTVLLAAPLPLAIYALGLAIDRFGTSIFWNSASEALAYVALTSALLEMTRQLFAPNGLAEIHFGWPTLATRKLHRGLRWTEATGLPLLFVALLFVFAGIRLDSPANLQIYNNSLGRVAFVAALLIIGISILTLLRPEQRSEVGDQDMRVPWPRRFAKYAFPTAFLGAYPILLVSTVIPALLAIFGFYITGLLLAYQMLRTLALVLTILILGGLVYRWRLIHRRRFLFDLEGDEAAPKKIDELNSAEKQVRQLFRVSVIVVMTIGLFTIWSDALPMLQILKRVQLLPTIELLEAQSESVKAFEGEIETEKPTDQMAADDPAPSQQSAAAASPEDSQNLTLWNLLKAILATVFTVVLVKNLPAVIEIILKRRTHLDSGARFAVSALIRYSATIIGFAVVFGMLGISWSRVQWLAAALTFGLGFGLQEIVANFVSGLILLIERPIRVGDVVTIGNLMGKVTRIQIRATTITLWDRSEMIVPNKEFITTKLVNWTLSDSKRRIEIPVRIVYGADLEEVKTILVDAAKAHPAVLAEPEPHALLLAFGDDAINIELRFVVDFGQGLTTKDQVQMVIENEFSQRGIEFALPQRQVRVVAASDGTDQPSAGFGQGAPEPTES